MAYNIDYSVEANDIVDLVDENDPDVDYDAKIKEVKDSLPKEMRIDLTEDDIDPGEPDSIADAIVDAVTNKSNWLINGCEFMPYEEYLKQKSKQGEM
jgi:hypothetical protein